MRSLEGAGLVIGREFTARVRTRGFVASCIISLAMLGLVGFLPKLSHLNDFTVGWTDSGSEQVAHATAAQARLAHLTVHLRHEPSVAAATSDVRGGHVTTAVLDGGATLLVKRDLPAVLKPLLLGAAGQEALAGALRNSGVDPARLHVRPPALHTLQPGPAGADERKYTAYLVMIVLLSQVLGFGYAVAGSVVEEKSSRIAEILMTSVRPLALLIGKLVGIGLAGLLQLFVIGGSALAFALATGSGPDTATTVGLAVVVVPWFLLAYAFLGTLYAAVAATVSRQEDLQSAATPLGLVFAVTVVAGTLGLGQLDAPLIRVLSYVPMLSPVVMTERWAGGTASWWEVIASMLVMALAVAAIAAKTATVYRTHLLHFGGRVPLLQALRRPVAATAAQEG